MEACGAVELVSASGAYATPLRTHCDASAATHSIALYDPFRRVLCLYVLSLEPVGAPRSGPISVGELLRQAMGGRL